MAPGARTRSAVWKYFSKLANGFSQCNICSRHLKTSGNTSNLLNHLKQKHTSIYNSQDQECYNVSTEKKRKTTLSTLNEVGFIANKESPTSLSTTSTVTVESGENLPGISNVEDGSSAVQHTVWPISYEKSKTSISGVKQPKILQAMQNVSSFAEGGSKYVKFTEAIVKFIVQDNMPFNTVEGKGFINLIKEIAPLYKLPSRNTIKNHIDKKYDIVSNAFKAMLKDIKYVTVTTDIWTADMQTKSFMGVTIHFIKECELYSATLGVLELSESHTATYISAQLLDVLNNWQIDIGNVVAIVTDNGANIVKAAQDLVGKSRHVPCFAHTVNLLCENSIKNTENLIGLIDKVRAIVVWFKRSVHASDELRKVQQNKHILEGNMLKLILDVKTRWNSTYYMLDRFVKLTPLLGNIILSNVNAPDMVSATELEELKQVCQLLHPLEQITTEMSGQKYVTLSKVVPMIGCLISQYENLQTSSDRAKDLKNAILKEMDKRFGSVEKCFLPSATTILDPRFKNIHFKEPVALANTIRHLKNEIAVNVPAESSSSLDGSDNSEDKFDLWAHHKHIAYAKRSKQKCDNYDEVTQYLSIPVRNLKEDPLELWDEMKLVYPNLYKLSQKYLCVAATSVPSEALFSKASATLTKSRNRLIGKRLSKLLFLQSLPEKFISW